jgi:hypothetical protein
MGQSLEGLAPDERLKRYRQFAEEALRKANCASNGDLRSGFLSMAGGWHALAHQLERQMLSAAPRTFIEEEGEADESRH